MPKKVDDDHCPICSQYMEVLVTAYSRQVFIDGRKYPIICHCCACVPKMYNFDAKKKELEVFTEFNPASLHTVEEMVGEGWDKKVAEVSIKAVKKIVRNRKGE